MPGFSIDLDAPQQTTAREDVRSGEAAWHPVRKWRAFNGPFCLMSIGITVILIVLASITLIQNFDVLTSLPRHAQAARVGFVVPGGK